MAREEEDSGSHRKKKRPGLGGWRLLLVCLVLGLAIGMLVEHQYIEPMLGENAKKLTACENSSKLLNQEIEHCYKQLSDFNSSPLS